MTNLKHFVAKYPKTGKSVDMHFKSLKEAQKRNPHLKDWHEVLP